MSHQNRAEKQTKRDAPAGDRNKQEQDLVDKLPNDTQPAEERGERLTTGKTIARGGHPQNDQPER